MVLFRRLLGDVLRRHRQEQSRTLRDVAASARISLGYLSEVERGRKEASSELLAALCEALGISLADVLREVSDDLALLEGARLTTTRFAPLGFAPVGVAPLGVAGRQVDADVRDARPVAVRSASVDGGSDRLATGRLTTGGLVPGGLVDAAMGTTAWCSVVRAPALPVVAA